MKFASVIYNSENTFKLQQDLSQFVACRPDGQTPPGAAATLDIVLFAQLSFSRGARGFLLGFK